MGRPKGRTSLPQKELYQCVVCGISQWRIRAEPIPRGGYFYKNENGEPWNVRKCPTCKKQEQIKCSRRIGHKPMDEVKYHPLFIGRKSENLVKVLLENVGCWVKPTTGKGPDLLVLGPQEIIPITMEVKTAVFSKGVWYVGVVRPARRQDDMVAIVLPNSVVYFESMKKHLNKCSPCGVRYLTKLIKKYCKELSDAPVS